MRGRNDPQVSMLAFVDLETRIPADHPLRTIKRLADDGAGRTVARVRRDVRCGRRPSIPPERLLKASLLIALYSVRSERAFCEELEYHLLFRWFLDMDLLEPGFDPSTFAKNRQRLLQHEVAQQFFDEVVAPGRRRGLLTDEHFTVDGTLIEAAASLKSFRRKDGEPPSAAAGRSGQPDGRLPRRAALQRHPPEHDRSRGAADPEGEGQGGEVCVHGPRPDGEPERLAGGLPGDRGDGHGGARCGAGLLDRRASGASIRGRWAADKNYDTRECVADIRAAG